MTIPKIVLIAGTRHSENIALMCTGCQEPFTYSVSQYRGDFGCNISEFESFLQWARGDAAQHECFLAGRVGYLAEPSEETLYQAWLSGRYPKGPERHEDPWGGVGYIVEPEDEDDLDAWMDEEVDFVPEDDSVYDILPPYSPLDAAATLNFKRLYEATGLEEPFGDNYDWEENRFDFLYGEPTEFKTYGTVTGRITVRRPILKEIPRIPIPPEYVEVVIDLINYADLEQRLIDEELLDLGVYSLDNLGCLRDEKGRCLACLRPGPHFPFYYDRDKR